MKRTDLLKITLAQIDLTWENPEENRRNIENLLTRIPEKSDLIVLPETFSTGFTTRDTLYAEPMDGPTVNWIRRLAKSTQMAICGTLLITEDHKTYNRFVFVTPDDQITYYDKRHIFSIGGESTGLSKGNDRVIINYLGWRIALYTCYDIRFPVWCRNQNDTDLMIFSANWPDSRITVWDILLKARAIENQVFVAGVNRVGSDGNGISYPGNSQLVNPRGEILPQQPYPNVELLTFEISLKTLNEFRSKFPVANDSDHFVVG